MAVVGAIASGIVLLIIVGWLFVQFTNFATCAVNSQGKS
jgi:hypothetical protein